MIDEELKIVRSITRKDKLSSFYKSQTRWELLLVVSSLQDSEDIGIWNYIEMLRTRTESHITIYQFIKDRIADGSFLVVPSDKKSRKVIKISKELQDELHDFLRLRYQKD